MALNQTRIPTSVEASSGTFNPATNQHLVVDDYPDTTPNDILTFGTATSVITFAYSAFTIPSTAKNIAVFVDYYDDEASTGNNNCGGRIKVGTIYYNATTHNPSTTQTARSDTWTVNPDNSNNAWTPDDINGVGAHALSAFGINSTDSNPTFFITSIQFRVTYRDTASIAGILSKWLGTLSKRIRIRKSATGLLSVWTGQIVRIFKTKRPISASWYFATGILSLATASEHFLESISGAFYSVGSLTKRLRQSKGLGGSFQWNILRVRKVKYRRKQGS